jgi:hypothetical protein
MGDTVKPSIGSRMLLSSYTGLALKPKTSKFTTDIPPRDELLAVAKSCRLLYTGYLDTLYATTTFCFTSARQFQTFSATLPRHRLAAISSLELHAELATGSLGWDEREQAQWDGAWATVAGMPGLRCVAADLRVCRRSAAPDASGSCVRWGMETHIFDPMKRVRHVKRFDVVVNWGRSRDYELGEALFTLERDPHRAAWSDVVWERAFGARPDAAGW